MIVCGTWRYGYTLWLAAAICIVIAGCGSGATPAPARPSAGASGATPAALSASIAAEIATAPTPSEFTTAPAPEMAAATVAVADFEGGSIPPDKKTDFWGRALASFMIAYLAASQNMRVVDREHLAAGLREQRLGATDLSDEATRLRVGKILGAKCFIFGTYTIVGDQAALAARMDAVETCQLRCCSRHSSGKEAARLSFSMLRSSGWRPAHMASMIAGGRNARGRVAGHGKAAKPFVGTRRARGDVNIR